MSVCHLQNLWLGLKLFDLLYDFDFFPLNFTFKKHGVSRTLIINFNYRRVFLQK